MTNNFVPTHPQTTVVTALGVNEVQKVTLTGLSDGTYQLNFDGEVTSASDAAVTAAQLRTKLEGLSNMAPGDVDVSGSAGGPFTITFQGAYAETDVPTIAVTATKGSPTVAVVTAGGGNPDAVQRGTGLADGTTETSPLEGDSPVEQRAAAGSDYGDA